MQDGTFDMRDMAHERVGEGYKNQWELLGDLFALVDYRLYLHYKYHQWLGPANDLKNMLGLVVSREEFEHNLKKAAQMGLYQRTDEEERSQMRLGELTVAQRLRVTKVDIPLLELLSRFELDMFARNCVILAYAAEVDGKYERLFAYLQDDITKKVPTVPFAVQLYLPDGATVEEYITAFSSKTLFTSLFSAEELERGNLVLRPVVREYLSSGKIAAPVGMEIFDGEEDAAEDPLVIRQALARELDAAMAGDGESVVVVTGREGSGRRFQIKHLMARRGERCLFADMAALEHRVGAVEEAALIARLVGAYCCFHHIDEVGEEGEVEPASVPLLSALKSAKFCREKLFLLCEKPVYKLFERVVVDLQIQEATASERLKLFEHYFKGATLAEDVSLQELASKFRFEPAKIMQAARQAVGIAAIDGKSAVDSATIHRCCYRQVVHKLDKLASRVDARFTFDDVVLPQRQKRLIQQACAHVKYYHKVYHEWGFDSKISYGKGLSILFAGAPGTGKTMCAQVIAATLNMEMYRINISQIVSKYIGETEKNLQAVFSEARHSNCILFFDECDAIFSKRSEVKDAHDRNANVEVAYLLQQIEEYDGVCILATNLMQNIDAAFMRRITFVVHFPFPDAQTRREIYIKTLPAAAQVADDIDWDFMAEKFNLSGGHIKNIVLGAAFMAAAEESPIAMRHMLGAAVNELRKNEIVVVREELREYADLLLED